MKKLFIMVAIVSAIFANDNIEKSDGEYICNIEYDKCMDECATTDDEACAVKCEDKFNLCIDDVLKNKTMIDEQDATELQESDSNDQ